MTALERHFQDFIRERTYIENVTERTLAWYQTAFSAYVRSRADVPSTASDPPITKRDLQQFVIHLRERGLKPVSCNCYLRAMNSFCRWLHDQKLTPEEVRLPLQRLEKRLLRTFDDAALRKLIAYKPHSVQQWRIHTLACTILDTGCRMHEVLLAPTAAFDFDNLLLTVLGKGRKPRRSRCCGNAASTRTRAMAQCGRPVAAEVTSTYRQLGMPSRSGPAWKRRRRG